SSIEPRLRSCLAETVGQYFPSHFLHCRCRRGIQEFFETRPDPCTRRAAFRCTSTRILRSWPELLCSQRNDFPQRRHTFQPAGGAARTSPSVRTGMPYFATLCERWARNERKPAVNGIRVWTESSSRNPDSK